MAKFKNIQVDIEANREKQEALIRIESQKKYDTIKYMEGQLCLGKNSVTFKDMMKETDKYLIMTKIN